MPDILHYIDDFWWAGTKHSNACEVTVAYMRALCTELGVPLAAKKIKGPTTRLTVLVIQHDIETQTISIHRGKI